MWVQFLPWAPEILIDICDLVWRSSRKPQLIPTDRGLAGVAGFGCFGRARNQKAVGSKRRHLAVELGGFLG